MDSSNLVKKLEKVSSLSNIVGISLVDRIKVSGINIGDTDISVTLKYQRSGGNLSNTGNASASSLPVTIIATKLPVSNLTQLLSMVEAMRNMEQQQQPITQTLWDQYWDNPDHQILQWKAMQFKF